VGGESRVPFGEEYPTPLLTSFQAEAKLSLSKDLEAKKKNLGLPPEFLLTNLRRQAVLKFL
jgi:hypothetical protein